MEIEYKYNKKPYSESSTIKKEKGWHFKKLLFNDFDISIDFFSCSTNWCMGSVITSGWEFHLFFFKYHICYLNRVIIKPPKILSEKNTNETDLHGY